MDRKQNNINSVSFIMNKISSIYSLVIILLLLGLFSCNTKTENYAFIAGTLYNFDEKVSMSERSATGTLQKLEETFILNSDNTFEHKIPMNKPHYYRLGRNTLFISPGDSLYMNIDYRDPLRASFLGKGAEANDYLKSKSFPKAGSYLSGGRLLKIKDLDSLVLIVNNLADGRRKELDDLNNISKEFKDREHARINFEQSNTFFSYPVYSRLMNNLSEEEFQKVEKESLVKFSAYLKNCLKDINNPEYLDIIEFRDIIEELEKDNNKYLLDLPELGQHINDYKITNEILSALSSDGLIDAVLEKRKTDEKKINSKDYLKIIKKSFDKYKTVNPGNQAPDFIAEDIKGNHIKLSDYQGKLIVIDIWATWCGPCLEEMPVFEEIEEEFKDSEVEFIALSIDSNREAWKKFIEKNNKKGTQIIINRKNLEPYFVVTIPRYIVISKKQKIINAFGPYPSTGELAEIIRKNL